MSSAVTRDRHQMVLLLTGGFDAEAFWATRVYKKWVVEIRAATGRQRLLQTLYVGARTKDAAQRTALANTSVRTSRVAVARLATPRDLGAHAAAD